MNDWFTVERLDQDTFAISEPKHWEETHCYLLLGDKRAALIDTGLGVSNIQQVVAQLTSLPVTVLTTHAHWDHLGGHGLFERFAVHEAEASWLTGHFPLPLAVVKQNLLRKPSAFPPDFSPDAYRIFQGEPSFLLHDGDTLDLGGHRLTVLHTPGHSPGHCCFYEADRGYLYTGDLLYAGCLDAFYPTTDPEAFCASVQRIRALPVKRLLPGHHQLHLPLSLTDAVGDAFLRLKAEGRLRMGSGVHDFGTFQIHL